MPIKLQVVKEDDSGEPADYLFEQDRITIGRGSGNDLTLPDQKVSSEHAEIRSKDGEYLLIDRESKNHTYVDGRRVGEDDPYQLKSGDSFRVGDFNVEFAPLFMPSSEQTAYADSEEVANPFEKHTKQLAEALEGLAETYKFSPEEERGGKFETALQDHLDADITDEEGVRQVLRALGVDAASDDSPEGGTSSQHMTTADETVNQVLDILLKSVSRMISIPDHFWREFTGDTLKHPEEKDFLYDADLDDLRARLLDESLSDEQRKERLGHLIDAVDSLVAHNMAMLAGYKKSVMAGSKELLQRMNPIDAIEEAEEGSMVDSFFGGGSKSELEHLHEQWKELYHGEWGALESELFRPTYVEAYVDRMAQTWDMDRAEIVNEEDA